MASRDGRREGGLAEVGLDTRCAFIADVTRTFGNLHARALAHATESTDKVRAALVNAVGDAELKVSRTEGHHGNPISILEASLGNERAIEGFFQRLPDEGIRALVDTLEKRVDDGCNLFLKLDKQRAFAGTIALGSGDDVISVRVKVRAFPAKREIAAEAVRDFFMRMLESRAETRVG